MKIYIFFPSCTLTVFFTVLFDIWYDAVFFFLFCFIHSFYCYRNNQLLHVILTYNWIHGFILHPHTFLINSFIFPAEITLYVKEYLEFSLCLHLLGFHLFSLLWFSVVSLSAFLSDMFSPLHPHICNQLCFSADEFVARLANILWLTVRLASWVV